MTTVEIFEVVEINDTQVHVRHILEKHFYTFTLDEGPEGKLQLSEQPVYVIEVADADNRADAHYGPARTFAEKEARARQAGRYKARPAERDE